MNRHIVLILLIFTVANGVTYAQSNKISSDSISVALHLNTLKSQKESLQKEIKKQDSKRNKQMAGVSTKTLEDMNNKQDSICLELRSALTDVNLEIKELTSITVTPQLMNQINNILKCKDKPQSKEENSSKSQQQAITDKKEK